MTSTSDIGPARPPWKIAAIYLLSSGFNTGLPILLLPFLSRFMTPADYGITALWQVLLNCVTPFVGLSIHAAMNVYCFRVPGNAPDRRVQLASYYASNLAVIGGSAGIALIGLCVLYRPLVQHLVDLPLGWVLITVVCAASMSIVATTLGFLNSELRPIAYATISNLQALMIAITSLSFIVFLGLGWKGRLLGQAIGVGSTALGCLAFMYHLGMLSQAPKRALIRHALLFVMPLVPAALAFQVRAVTDRIFMSQIADVEEIGKFAVALSLSMVFSVVGYAIQQTWQPWLYRQLAKRDRAVLHKVVALTYIGFLGFAIAGLLFILAAPITFAIVVGPAFAGAIRYVPLLTSGACVQGMYYLLVPYIGYASRTYYSLFISLTALGLNIAFNLFLIPRFGTMGVAGANFLSFVVEFALVWFAVTRCITLPWYRPDFKSLWSQKA